MYTSIRIQNFRGLKDLTIENLGRVNLLVGANNVGKTSVLEALAFLRARPDGYEIRQLLSSRGYRADDSFTDVWSDLIYRGSNAIDRFLIRGDLEDTKHGVTGFAGNEGTNAQLNWHPITHYLVQLRFGERVRPAEQVSMGQQLLFLSLPTLVLIHLDIASGERPTPLDLPQQPVYVDLPDPHALPPTRGSESIFGPTVWFPFGYSFGVGGLADALTRMQGSKRYDTLLKVLSAFDQRVKGLYPGYDSIERRPVVRVGIADVDANLGLPTLGDGMRRLTELLIATPRAHGGVAMIDEIDAGIYYDNLQTLWWAVDGLSVIDQVQLFVTTHNIECVEAAVRAFNNEHADDFRLHRLSRRGEEIVVTTYDHEAAEATLNVGVEFR
jgi:hypothetical protein